MSIFESSRRRRSAPNRRRRIGRCCSPCCVHWQSALARAWRGGEVSYQPLEGEGRNDDPYANTNRLTEELRVIKRRLLATQRSANKPRSNIFMVASALPGDGKSFMAWNLARSLSEEQDQE